MIIREYNPADEKGWLRCRVVAFLDTSYHSDVRTEKETYLQPEMSLVAEDNGQIIGILDTEIDSYDLSVAGEERGAMIWHIAVLPEYRRQGVAKKLLAEAKKRLAAQGVHYCEAWTQEDEAANAFYKAEGFTLNNSHTWLRCRANAAGVEKMVTDEARDGIFGVEELVFNAPVMRRAELELLCDKIEEVRMYSTRF